MSTEKEKKEKEKFESPALFLNDEVRLPWGPVEGPPMPTAHSPEIFKGDLVDERPAARGCLSEKERLERSELLSSSHGPLSPQDRKRLAFLLLRA